MLKQDNYSVEGGLAALDKVGKWDVLTKMGTKVTADKTIITSQFSNSHAFPSPLILIKP